MTFLLCDLGLVATAGAFVLLGVWGHCDERCLQHLKKSDVPGLCHHESANSLLEIQ